MKLFFFFIAKQFINKNLIPFEHLLSLVQKYYCYYHTCRVFSIRQFSPFYDHTTKYLLNDSKSFLKKNKYI